MILAQNYIPATPGTGASVGASALAAAVRFDNESDCTVFVRIGGGDQPNSAAAADMVIDPYHWATAPVPGGQFAVYFTTDPYNLGSGATLAPASPASGIGRLGYEVNSLPMPKATGPLANAPVRTAESNLGQYFPNGITGVSLTNPGPLAPFDCSTWNVLRIYAANSDNLIPALITVDLDFGDGVNDAHTPYPIGLPPREAKVIQIPIPSARPLPSFPYVRALITMYTPGNIALTGAVRVVPMLLTGGAPVPDPHPDQWYTYRSPLLATLGASINDIIAGPGTVYGFRFVPSAAPGATITATFLLTDTPGHGAVKAYLGRRILTAANWDNPYTPILDPTERGLYIPSGYALAVQYSAAAPAADVYLQWGG